MGLGKITVVQYGFGPVGLEIVETILTRPWTELVGAIDTDDDKISKAFEQ